jgi:PAS domain S-box-containing protein
MDPDSVKISPPGDGSGGDAAKELLYRGLFEHSQLEVHIWELLRGRDGEIVTWKLVDANPLALESWGRSLEEVAGLTADEVFPGANATETFLPIVSEIMETGVPKAWETDFDGTGQVLQMVSYPVGEFFVSTGFDITDHRLRQQELDQALESLNQAVEAGGVGLWDWDLRTNKVRFSDEWKRQLGHLPHEIADDFEEWQTRVHPDDLEGALASVQRGIETAAKFRAGTFRMRHKDGTWRWILAQSSVFLDDAGKPARMLGSHLDITERRQMEEQVQKAQKLEAIGTLAAGIAHDFNNLLGALTGNLSLLREAGPDDPDREELLDEVERAALGAQALTAQLLTFSKGGAPIREVTSMRQLVTDCARFVTRGSRSHCRFEVDEDLASAEVDAGQIGQVINNLVINAMQAMPDGGTITVGGKTEDVGPEDEQGLPPGRYVHVWVQDDGPGIPPEILDRIFDPFFTTKSHGTGLGLSTSYSIISRHEGRMAVSSEPSAGTRFDIYLPASEKSVRPRLPDAVVQGSGRVLIMDDNEALREVTSRMLRALGYECDSCEDGMAAVAACRKAVDEGRPYDAAILDLTIPGKDSGHRVLSRLREVDPDLVAIVASGYGDSEVLARYEEHGFQGRILKPANLVDTSTELARVLAGRTAD